MQIKRQRGFSMIEAILSVVILSAIVLFFTQTQVQTNRELQSKQTAEAMENFTEIASQYLLQNRAAMLDALKTGAGANTLCVINADPSTGVGTTAFNTTLHTCAVDVSFLKFKKVVPLSYKETNHLKQKWTAIYRLVYADYDNNAATAPTEQGSVEMLVIGARNGGEERAASADDALLTASITGYTGGYVPNGTWGGCSYSGTDKRACGISGDWEANLAEFLNTP